jgi:hypothetical protein
MFMLRQQLSAVPPVHLFRQTNHAPAKLDGANAITNLRGLVRGINRAMQPEQEHGSKPPGLTVASRSLAYFGPWTPGIGHRSLASASARS